MLPRVLARSMLLFSLACAPKAAPTVAACPDAAAPTSTAAVPIAAAPRTIIVVRHGEKESDATDALLSAAGHARARCLAAVLADVPITHMFATEYARTRDTLAPLAERRSLTPTIIPAKAKSDWVAALRGLAGGSIAVVAGHSNSIPDLLAELGAGTVTVEHDAYDWLFVLTLREDGAASLLRTHYCTELGEPPSVRPC